MTNITVHSPVETLETPETLCSGEGLGTARKPVANPGFMLWLTLLGLPSLLLFLILYKAGTP